MDSFSRSSSLTNLLNYKRKSDLNLSQSQTSKQPNNKPSPEPPKASFTKLKPDVKVDVQSKGLASRIVKYHDSNQSSYKPGEFPIVHLKRNDIVLKKGRSNSLSSIKIACPDRNVGNLHRRRQILQRGLSAADFDYYNEPLPHSQPSRVVQQQQEDQFSGTRSVLDALKEISRKRINRYDDEGNDHKKLCTETGPGGAPESVDGVVKNPKRQREHISPTISPSTSMYHRPKKICSDNLDVISSMSSSIGLLNKSKSGNLKQNEVQDKRPQQKLKPSATTIEKSDYPPPIPQPNLKASASVPLMKTQKPIEKTPPKVTLFNQNYDKIIAKKGIQNPAVEENEDEDDEEGAASSIFVKPKKSSPILSTETEVLKKIEKNKLAMMLKCLAGDFEESDEETEVPPPSQDTVDNKKEDPKPDPIPEPKPALIIQNPTPPPPIAEKLTSNTTIPLIDFSTPKSIEVPSFVKPILAPESKTEKPATQEKETKLPTIVVTPEKPGFEFATPTKKVEEKSNQESTPAMFKFNTPPTSSTFVMKSTSNSTIDTSTPTTVPSFSLNQPKTTVESSPIPTVTFSLPQKKAESPINPTFSFGNTTSAANPPAATNSASFSFSANKPVSQNVETVKAPAINFGVSSVTTASSAISFGNTTTTTSQFTFGSSSAPSTTSASVINPTFGAKTQTITSPSFTFSNKTPATTSSFAFSASNFGAPTTTPAATQPATATPSVFGSTSSPITNVFGAAAKPSMPTTATSSGPVFGSSIQSTQSTNMFGSTPAAPTATSTAAIQPAFSFGSTTNSPTNSVFGATPSKPVESASKPDQNLFSFGGPPANTQPAFAFGATPATTSSTSLGFGSTNVTAPSIFGSNATSITTAQSSPFNTTSTVSSSPFGGNATNSTNPVFGSSTFGGNSAPTENKSTFGGNITSPSNQAKPFAFGGPTQNETKPPPPAFGQSNTFNFGGSNSSQGNSQNNPPAFQFGQTPTSSSFSFGQSTSSAPPAQTAPFAFGQSNSQPPPPSYNSATSGSMGFGQQSPSPAFNFGATAAPDPNAFGGNNLFSIGTGGGQTNQQRRQIRTATRRNK